MSVYKKLTKARAVFVAEAGKLKKSGYNSHSRYSYFELRDFLPLVLQIFDDIGLCGVVTFDDNSSTKKITRQSRRGEGKDKREQDQLKIDSCAFIESSSGALAKLTIVDVDAPNDVIVITSRMGYANLVGCHDVQNLGASQSYMRRYLWLAAMEIAENDQVDAGVYQKTDVDKQRAQITDAQRDSVKVVLDASAKMGMTGLNAAFAKLQKDEALKHALADIWKDSGESYKKTAKEWDAAKKLEEEI